ncbi:MAG: hypothetical protein DMG57_07025 [Acidobacteria bacterium]|nr:MAG: hypothetical protein DMG57_07025 [Acidobacteriota bacterium]
MAFSVFVQFDRVTKASAMALSSMRYVELRVSNRRGSRKDRIPKDRNARGAQTSVFQSFFLQLS